MKYIHKNRASANRMFNATWNGWDSGAVIVGLIMTVIELVVLLMKPTWTIVGHTVTVTQGVLIPAFLVGALLWSTVEAITPPGQHFWHVMARFIPAIFIGMIIGGALGYAYEFGAYVLVPAFHGNAYAQFYLFTGFLATLMFLWNAAYLHNKSLVQR